MCQTYSWNKGGLKLFCFREYGPMFASNLLLSAALLSSPTHILRMLNHMNVATIAHKIFNFNRFYFLIRWKVFY